MLTDKELRNCKPTDKIQKLGAAKGLAAWVYPSGLKRWQFRYVDASGKEQAMALGDYPQLSIAEAVAKAEALQNDRRNKIDPVQAAKAREGHTVEEVARAWHAKQLPIWKPKHAADVLKLLEQDVFQTIGGRDVADVTVRDIVDLLEPIEKRSIDIAHRTRGRLETIFAFAKVMGYTRDNPAFGIGKAMTKMPKGGKRPALIDLDDVRTVLRTVETADAQPITKLANRFLALTVMRPGEVRFMEWTEIKGDVWEVPGPRMKMKDAHRIPLSRQALEVIEAVRPLSGHSPYVFAASHNVGKPISENAVGFLLNRNGFQGRHCPHGWRTSFSTHINARPPACVPQTMKIADIVEAALAHLPDDDIRAAYNRGDYFDARRDVMQVWADTLLIEAMPLAAVVSGPRH